MLKHFAVLALVLSAPAFASPSAEGGSAALQCRLEARTNASGVGVIGTGQTWVGHFYGMSDGARGHCLVLASASGVSRAVVESLRSEGYALSFAQTNADPNVAAVACFRDLEDGQVEATLHGLWNGDAAIQQTDREVLSLQGAAGDLPALGLIVYPADFDRAWSSVSLKCAR